jgi:tetratricopeptide (TPR) repeat protein
MLIIDLETPRYINYHTPKHEDPDITLVAENTLEANDEEGDHLTPPVFSNASDPEDVKLVTDFHPYFRSPPFINKPLSEVTSDTAAEAEAQALYYDILNDVTNAIPAYLDAIEQRAQASGEASAAVCGLFSMLVSIYTTTGRLDASVSSYHRATAPYQEGLHESILLCVPDMYRLTQVLIQQREYKKAEDISRRAVQILEQVDDQKLIIYCKLNLGELLQQLNCHEEAIRILHTVLNSQMRLGWDHTSISCTLTCLIKSYREAHPSGGWSTVISRMSSVADACSSSKKNPPWFSFYRRLVLIKKGIWNCYIDVQGCTIHNRA